MRNVPTKKTPPEKEKDNYCLNCNNKLNTNYLGVNLLESLNSFAILVVQ